MDIYLNRVDVIDVSNICFIIKNPPKLKISILSIYGIIHIIGIRSL